MSLTISELLFEQFCTAHSIEFERVPKAAHRAPDYRVFHRGESIYFEIKQIDADEEFSAAVATRQIGSHLCEKISQARGQMKTAAQDGHKAVLLVMNNLDGLQLFGTEQTDFIAAMYGDWEIDYSGRTN